MVILISYFKFHVLFKLSNGNEVLLILKLLIETFGNLIITYLCDYKNKHSTFVDIYILIFIAHSISFIIPVLNGKTILNYFPSKICSKVIKIL